MKSEFYSLMIIACLLVVLSSACGGDDLTTEDCKLYCDRYYECDETTQVTDNWLEGCYDRCTYTDEEANMLSINKDVIACIEIEDCKEFRICVKSGGEGWNAFAEK